MGAAWRRCWTAIDAEPARARLCFVEAQKGGPRAARALRGGARRGRATSCSRLARAGDRRRAGLVAAGAARAGRGRERAGPAPEDDRDRPRSPTWPMAERRGEPQSSSASGSVRLPPGRHGLPREFVAENQRERLLNGVVEAVAEHGYNATTIGKITDAAKISRRTFYEYFKDKEGCFLAAYEMIDAHVRGAMLPPATPLGALARAGAGRASRPCSTSSPATSPSPAST